MVRLNKKYVLPFVSKEELKNIGPMVSAAHKLLREGTGAAADRLGWLDLPATYDIAEFEDIKATAKKIREICDVFVVIGIGGSYLGARAAIEFIKSEFCNRFGGGPEIYFAGNNISAASMANILELCRGRRVCINVISKSGSTTEPAIAFRIFRGLIEETCGVEGARERIFVTTDRTKGYLRKFAGQKGYTTFTIPDDVGGRFSVLTAVGLLPIAVAGLDIDELMAGAGEARLAFAEPDLDKNDSLCYAALRNILYRKGRVTEILVGYEQYMQMFCEWYKQLFGESEGKDNKGIYPSSLIFTTDLHSLGQYVQDGLRNQFETVLRVMEPDVDLVIPDDPENIDGLGFLSGMSLSFVNQRAMEGTLLAHVDGGVPNLVIEIDRRDERNLGSLIYFFELACAISGYLSGVNPFDQPGVEKYKNNMFALLGKPGFELRKKELEDRIR